MSDRPRRVALVGSGSRVGRTILDAFAGRGDDVVGLDLVPDADDPHDRIVADLSRGDDADAAITEAVARLGGLDVLVTAAAHQRPGRLADTSDEDWRAVMAGTLDTAFHAMRSALPHLERGGAIVAISSVNAVLAHPQVAAYAAAKGALNALVTQAALDYAPRGIRINAVSPGLIDDGADPARSAGYPLGLTPNVQDVADAVLFLAGPAARAITGVVLPLDAGLSITSAAVFARPSLLERFRAD